MAAIDNLLCRYQPVHKNRPTNEVFPVKASFAVKIWVIIYTYICVCLIKVYIRISKMTILHYIKLLEVLMKNRVAKNG